MNSRHNQKGSALEISIIAVLVVVVIGVLGFVFWNNFVNKPVDNTQTAQKQSAVIESLKAKFKVSKYEQYSTPGADSWTARQTYKTDEPFGYINFDSAFQFNFNNSEQGLPIPEIVKIIKSEGLAKAYTLNNVDYYQSMSAICNVESTTSTDTTRVICATKDSTDSAIADAHDASSALLKSYPDLKFRVNTGSETYVGASIFRTEDNPFVGVVISNLANNKLFPGAVYMVKQNDIWKDVGSDTAENYGFVAPTCEVIGHPYQNIFRLSGCS